ncbi:AmmeMemoRadiSam system radical SAM enzyme [Clostridium sp. LIBA-8841]|uniref:AmmeMemoRadiSam system radical SAM enzyme n=1 Tax=Clostridium sp. LIBA-8841 TaxID=2987530 RepID=UPI002AC38524|nr:AmmeMemoRadiSam system radical SAM enzyme [Clostridium sp. LIBA-8841]MDZ5253511.1 AmmeMemoRadiSam system radical SAM enzyme [Clostridium sp. LIBA-8841]
MKKEALYYKHEGEHIRCYLCPHNCLIGEGKRGICNVREVSRDEERTLRLYSINYGEITSISLDPIEKKPLYHFLPGNNILSIGSFGCNFKCSFCQNYSISQYEANSRFVSPEDMAETSLSMNQSIGLAFTYNEPSIWYEYVLDVSKKIKELNPAHKIVLVTNGYISEEPLKDLLPYVDALNIDLKGNDEYYKRLCFGSLDEVERIIMIANEMGKHVEVTTLLVSGSNTDNETLKHIGKFLNSIDKSIPIHISRYFPRYKMKEEATSLEEMKNAYKFLSRYLDNIHLGNLSKDELEYCLEK